MIERTESVIEQRTVNLIATATEGITATIEGGGQVVTITCASIEGQSTLRIPSSKVAAVVVLAQTIQADEALVIPPEREPELPAEGDTEEK